MVSINLVGANTWGGTSSLVGTTATTATSAVEAASQTSDVAAAASNAPQISTLARQLSEAAERAAVRDEGKTRTRLAALEKVLMSQIAGDRSFFSGYKADAAAEMPKTDDPELLVRAKQATDFISGRSTQNPFAGLSREQLSLIMYDQGDAFTLNERSAAWIEHFKQREAWSQRVVAQGWNERQTTGANINFYKACIAEYQTASAIEQSTYHPFYVARMEHYIRFWEGGGRDEDTSVSEQWKKSMEALMRQLPNSFGDDYSEGDKLWGAAPRAANGLEIGSRQYDKSLSWGLSSKLAMPVVASTGLAENSPADLYIQNQPA